MTLLQKTFLYIFSPDLLRQKLIINAIYILGISLFPGLIGISFWALSGRFYQPEEVGLASAVLSAVGLIAMIANLGMSISIVRFLPEAADRPRLMNTIYTFVLVGAITLSAIYLIGSPLWAVNLSGYFLDMTYISGFVIFVIVTALGSVIRDTFIAFREAQYALNYTILTQVLRIGFLIFGILFPIIGMVGSSFLAYTIALVFSVAVWLKRLEPIHRPRLLLDYPILKRMIPYSLGNHLSVLLLQLPQLLFPLLILEMIGAAASAYAYIALMLGGVITSPGLALSNSAFAESSNQPLQANRIILKTGVIGVGITLLLSGLTLFTGPILLSIFGSAYAEQSAGLLRIMALAAPFIVLNQVHFTYLRFHKRTRQLVILNVLLAALILGIAWGSIQQVGANACGFGILAGNLALSSIIIIVELVSHVQTRVELL